MPFLGRKATTAAQGFGLNSSGKVKFDKQEYTTAGTYTFTVPTGNNSVIITASGGGGAGQTSYFNAGSWGQSNGSAGGNTTVTNGTFTITANGGGGGNSGSTGGTVSISGATLLHLIKQVEISQVLQAVILITHLVQHKVETLVNHLMQEEVLVVVEVINMMVQLIMVVQQVVQV